MVAAQYQSGCGYGMWLKTSGKEESSTGYAAMMKLEDDSKRRNKADSGNATRYLWKEWKGMIYKQGWCPERGRDGELW